MIKHRKTLLLWMALTLPLAVSAQDFHEPSEILQIMDKSKMAYSILEDAAVEPFPITLGSDNIPFTYAKQESDQWTIANYELDSVSQEFYDLAEEAFAAKQFAAARGHYLKIYELRPDVAVIMTFLGQTYEEEGNRPEAMVWYQRAIDVNFHDYMAHWFLADNLYELKEYKRAASEIALAWILNRNSHAIRESVTKIFKADKRQFEDFEFEPLYAIAQDGKQVKIRYHKDWMIYAFVKALWSYEPNYHPELGGGRSEFDMFQEKECLLNLAILHDRSYRGKHSKFPALDILINAIERHQINEYIFMERWLRMEPLIVYTQTPKAIATIADYILEVRAPKKH